MPDHFSVVVDGSWTVSSADLVIEVDGSLTSCEIPAGTLKPGTNDIMIGVHAVNETTSMGPLAGEGSRVSATFFNMSPAFSTQ